MDDTTTPTPTKSIDGMTPGKAPAPSTVASPAPEVSKNANPIDIKNLDGDLADAATTTNSPETDIPMSAPEETESAKGDSPAPEMTETAAPEATKPPIAFDAKAAEAAMAAEDATPAPAPASEMPINLNAANEKTTMPMTQKPKGKGRTVAIIVAVVIALGLIGGASYAFWNNNKNKKTATTNTAATTAPATGVTDKVKTASDGIDSELNKIDDTKEFQSSDISDTTLGL